ncbi:MAG: ATP-binding protein [Ignavibacteria bacterium]|nr:ATP-binding protein [Ignavibacteria bacterium]
MNIFDKLKTNLDFNYEIRDEVDGVCFAAFDIKNILRIFETLFFEIVLITKDSTFNNDSSRNSEEFITFLLNQGIGSESITLFVTDDESIINIDKFNSSKWVWITNKKLVSILNEKNPKDFFRKEIIKRVPIHTLSPYQIKIAVSGKMFFDREHELEKVTNLSENFAIFGPRKIGKTSLAKKIKEHYIKNRNYWYGVAKTNRSFYSVAYVDCDLLNNFQSSEEVLFEYILNSMELLASDYNRSKKIFRKKITPLTPYEFLQKLLETRFRYCTIILDEVDKLLRIDEQQQWAIFQKLRALIDNYRVKFILVGFKDLSYSLNKINFPFFQRLTPLSLGNLDKNSARKLILEPLDELCVILDHKDEIVDKIYYYTGGLPSLIQAVCSKTIEELYQSKTSAITPELIAKVINLVTPLQTLLRYFEMEMEPLAQLLVYFTARDNDGVFRTREFMVYFKRRARFQLNHKDLMFSLDHLCISNIFQVLELNEKYSFVIDAFWEIIKRRISEYGFETMIKPILAKISVN